MNNKKLNMIKKEYYRLNELNKRFDVTFDDVQYAVESGALKLAFHVSNQDFVIGRRHLTKGLIASGIASYSGLVSISDNEQLELIKNGSIKCRQFTLLQKSNITLLESKYPFKSSIPNKLLAEWKPKTLEQITFKTVAATICPKEQKNALKGAGQTFLKLMTDIGEKNEQDVKVDTSVYDKLSDYQFQFEDIELDVNHLCVLHSDLQQLGVVTSEEESPQTISAYQEPILNENNNNSVKRSSQLAELIERILHSNSKIKAVEVWRKLREEAELDSLDRKYDVDGILKDVTPNELLWQSRYGTNSNIKRSTFDAKVSRIRKKMGINKK
jgi:hypothetical protein